MQPGSSRAHKVAFNPESWKLRLRRNVIGMIRPLTRGSLSVSVRPWLSAGGVGVPSSHFGAEVNSMTSIPFSHHLSGLLWGLGGFPRGPSRVSWPADGLTACYSVSLLATLKAGSRVLAAGM